MTKIESAKSGISDGALTLTTTGGDAVTVPFDTTFLSGPL
jgi:hypothetical protein